MAVKHKAKCWRCGRKHTAATGAFDKSLVPKDGDITLCIRCGEWSVFASTDPSGIRRPTIEEFMEIGEDPRCRKLRDAWTKLKRKPT